MDKLDTPEDLKDKILDLEAKLQEAVTMAVVYGAHDWARKAYPDHPALSQDPAESPASHVYAGKVLRGTLKDMVRDVAMQEREMCLSAVSGIWDKIEGTPYYCGPRKFCDAIRSLPKPADLTLKVSGGVL